jgi:hypothetical protein
MEGQKGMMSSVSPWRIWWNRYPSNMGPKMREVCVMWCSPQPLRVLSKQLPIKKKKAKRFYLSNGFVII